MLILSAGLKPDGQGLLDRSSTSSALLSILERIWISKLRAAPRELAGLPGEELVRTYVEKNDARVYSFWWEVNGTEDNVLVPHFCSKWTQARAIMARYPLHCRRESQLVCGTKYCPAFGCGQSIKPSRSLSCLCQLY